MDNFTADKMGINLTEDKSDDTNDGAWGSSSYAKGFNSTTNMTTNQILQLYLGPQQVFFCG
jgi:hypothetical protein